MGARSVILILHWADPAGRRRGGRLARRARTRRGGILHEGTQGFRDYSMPHYFSVHLLRNLRPAAILCLSVAALCFGDAGLVLTRAGLYQAAAPVADRSEAAQTEAFQTAMKIVLVRVTGRRSAEDDPTLAPLVGNARRYVQQYRGAPDSQVWVSFDGPAIERWLTQNGQPLWGRERPSTLVWLSVATGPQSTAVVSADDSSELKDAMDAAALLRGIPLVWPPAASANAAANAPADVARRLGAEGVLVGRANNAAATAAVHWTLQFQDRS